MPFTAPSVANKGNRFRIVPRTDILAAVRELVVFNILQDTLMLIPTLGPHPVKPSPDSTQDLALGPGGRLIAVQPVNIQAGGSGGRGQILSPPRQPFPDSPAGLFYQPAAFSSHERYFSELIAATRVLDSTWRTDENLLVWPFIPPGPTPGMPVKVRACSVKNLVSWSRLFPLPSGGRALALAYYTYEVEIVYADGAGCTATLTLESGLRRQQAVVYPGPGYLEVDVRLSCLGSNVTSPVIPRPQPQHPPAYKPAWAWLQASPAGGNNSGSDCKGH
ncbi:hypothetical protein SDD30_11005 [Moorella naiadis]|uniref:hypothetical protein n=1 Tax=Moorella naiadis (nom. illeg.) TaxID=3093670 RepID=UPI003D9C8B71